MHTSMTAAQHDTWDNPGKKTQNRLTEKKTDKWEGYREVSFKKQLSVQPRKIKTYFRILFQNSAVQIYAIYSR